MANTKRSTAPHPPSRRSGSEEHYSGKWAVTILGTEPTELVSPLCADEQTAKILMEIGVDYAQGYYYGYPSPPIEF